MSDQFQDQGVPAGRDPSAVRTNDHLSNLVVMGMVGSGKSTTGTILARLLGLGFIDTDDLVAAKAGQSINAIFADGGETRFRTIERDVILGLKNIKNHVVAIGGGAVVEDENWQVLRGIGPLIWINTPLPSIARRLAKNKSELAGRPMFSELAQADEGTDIEAIIAQRLAVLMKSRMGRYREARLVLEDGYSTPETSAHLLQEMLVRENIMRKSKSGVWKWPI